MFQCCASNFTEPEQDSGPYCVRYKLRAKGLLSSQSWQLESWGMQESITVAKCNNNNMMQNMKSGSHCTPCKQFLMRLRIKRSFQEVSEEAATVTWKAAALLWTLIPHFNLYCKSPQAAIFPQWGRVTIPSSNGLQLLTISENVDVLSILCTYCNHCAFKGTASPQGRRTTAEQRRIMSYI